MLARLDASPDALRRLRAMEQSGDEPDVIGTKPGTGRIVPCDCAPESPAGRRSPCFDRVALDARRENRPRGDAQGMAAGMGIAMLTEAEYRHLQTLGAFDRKTFIRIATPARIRALGGALLCDRHHGTVLVDHNGAEACSAACGFRGKVLV